MLLTVLIATVVEISLAPRGSSANTVSTDVYQYEPSGDQAPSFVDQLDDSGDCESVMSDLTYNEFEEKPSSGVVRTGTVEPVKSSIPWQIPSTGTTVGHLVDTAAFTRDGHHLGISSVFSGVPGLRGILYAEALPIVPDGHTRHSETWGQFLSKGRWTVLRCPASSYGELTFSIRGWTQATGSIDAHMDVSVFVSDFGAFRAAREGHPRPKRFISIAVKGSYLKFSQFYVLEHLSARRAARGEWERGWKVDLENRLLGTLGEDFGGEKRALTHMLGIFHKATTIFNGAHFLTVDAKPALARGGLTWSHLSIHSISPSGVVSEKFIKKAGLSVSSVDQGVEEEKASSDSIRLEPLTWKSLLEGLGDRLRETHRYTKRVVNPGVTAQSAIGVFMDGMEHRFTRRGPRGPVDKSMLLFHVHFMNDQGRSVECYNSFSVYELQLDRRVFSAPEGEGFGDSLGATAWVILGSPTSLRSNEKWSFGWIVFSQVTRSGGQ